MSNSAKHSLVEGDPYAAGFVLGVIKELPERSEANTESQSVEFPADAAHRVGSSLQHAVTENPYYSNNQWKTFRRCSSADGQRQ